MTAVTKDTTVEELAGIVAEQLRLCGLNAVLSGGALVSLYSENQYQSNDIDFVTSAGIKEIGLALEAIGFTRTGGRHFSHPESDILVEFPAGPLMVGNEHVTKISAIATRYGAISVLSPTDSVKDRLAAFLHWGDPQGWAQAQMIASRHPVDLADITRWCAGETNDSTLRRAVTAGLEQAAAQRPHEDSGETFQPG